MKNPSAAKQRIFRLIACLPSILLAGIGLITLIRGKIFNLTWLLAYAALPLFLAWLFCRLLRSKMKLFGKALTYSSILLLGFLLLTAIALFGRFEWIHRYEGEALNREYPKSEAAGQLMPSPDELDSAQSIEYCAYSAQQLIFSWHADALFCTYDPADYEAEKAQLSERFHFQQEKIGDCDPSVEADGYLFRLLDVEKYSQYLWYPKKLMLIGANDQKREIVYLLYSDPDLDYIESTEKLLRNLCGWNYMQ